MEPVSVSLRKKYGHGQVKTTEIEMQVRQN